MPPRRIKLPYLKEPMPASSIAISGSWQGVRYISENDSVHSVGVFFPSGAALAVDKLIMDGLKIANEVIVPRIRRIAQDYKIPTYIKDPLRPFKRLERYGIGELRGDRFVGDVKPYEIRRYMDARYSEALGYNPADCAVMALLFNFNQTPIPLRNTRLFCVKFAEHNNLKLRDAHVMRFLATQALILASRKIRTYMIDNVLLVSGPKIDDPHLAELIVKRQLGDFVAKVSDSPAFPVDPTQAPYMDDLRATGFMEFVQDQVLGKVYRYAILRISYDQVVNKFGEYMAEQLIKVVGRLRLRDLGIVPDQKEVLFEPLSTLPAPIDETLIRDTLESLYTGVFTSRYAHVLTPAERARREATEEAYRRARRQRRLNEFF
mgnify:CR=1 FL=1